MLTPQTATNADFFSAAENAIADRNRRYVFWLLQRQASKLGSNTTRAAGAAPGGPLVPPGGSTGAGLEPSGGGTRTGGVPSTGAGTEPTGSWGGPRGGGGTRTGTTSTGAGLEPTGSWGGPRGGGTRTGTTSTTGAGLEPTGGGGVPGVKQTDAAFQGTVANPNGEGGIVTWLQQGGNLATFNASSYAAGGGASAPAGGVAGDEPSDARTALVATVAGVVAVGVAIWALPKLVQWARGAAQRTSSALANFGV